MSKKVRVRFAPSPTGPLHIGGVRTALFNYLFAKKQGGDFILRIEDTDQTRYVEGSEQYIADSFEWLNLPFDESPENPGKFGPYRQSERKSIYKKYADQLIESGHAYYAFDTPEELDQKRKEYEEKGETFIYNWHNRTEMKNSLNLTSEEVREKIKNNEHFVIRFKSPGDESLHLKDIIRGDIHVETKILDDKVLFKSDGMPTYHLANIVDDHLMEITHVIRGEEWLPSLPLHILLYRAFDWTPPQFAHLPLILKPTGKGKLSKRDGDKMGFPVFPLEWKGQDGEISSGYREDGYLPETVVNMLALLGWNPGTEQEIFSIEELIEAFDIERVQKGGARFDPEKTKWFQNQYFQKLPDELLLKDFENLLKKRNIASDVDLERVLSLIKERASFVEELWEQGNFFFDAPDHYDEKAVAKAFKPGSGEYLKHVKTLLNEISSFDSGVISEKIKEWIVSEKIGFGNVMMPLRLALVGEMKGPDVFDIISIIGPEETERRLDKAISFISS